MKKVIQICLLVGFMISGLLSQTEELRNYRLRKIDFIGNVTFKNKQLKKVITLRPVITKQGMKGINYRYIKSERKKIQNFYVSEGFLNSSVKDSLVIYDKNKIHLYFKIKEKERFRIRQISISGNQRLTDGEIFEILELKIGDPFRQQEYYNSIKKVLSRYSEIGRPFANIKEEFQWSPDMEIRLMIEENENYPVGQITISGNEDVLTRSVKKQLVISEGDLYKQSKINRSRDRIYEMGTFNSVNIDPELPDSSEERIELSVNLVEGRARRFDVTMGARQGYTEKVDYSALFVEPSWLHKNIFKRAHRLNINGSYEAIIQNVNIGNFSMENGLNAEVGYTIPWLGPLRLPTTFQLYYNRNVYSPFSNEDVAENDVLTDYGVGISNIWRYNRKTYTRSSFLLRNLKSELSGTGFEPQLEINLNSRFDNRDNFIYPTRGLSLMLYGKYVFGTEIETETEYIQGDISISNYQSLFKNMTMAFRLEAGQIFDFKNINPIHLYRMGSETTVRGWFQSIGRAHEVVHNGDTITIYADKAKILGNIEFRYDIIWNFGVNAFADAGKLDENFRTVFDWDQYYVDAGFGIYYKTPIGAVRLEFPIRLNDPQNEFDDRTFWQKMTFGLLFAF